MGEKYLTKEGKFDYHKWVRLNSITEKVTVQPNASTMGSSLSHKLDGKQTGIAMKWLMKNKQHKQVKNLLKSFDEKYSDSVEFNIDGGTYSLYASYGALRLGAGGKLDDLDKTITKDIFKQMTEGKVTITEAPMDQRFAKEWEQMHKAFINHLKHEIKKGKGVVGQTNLGAMKNMLRSCEVAKGFAKLLGQIVGDE
mgnify:FL=1|tara:strand:- start:1188 stop:1775 length:588 start_codon:yes stop_codon:yes gene_type:complete